MTKNFKFIFVAFLLLGFFGAGCTQSSTKTSEVTQNQLTPTDQSELSNSDSSDTLDMINDDGGEVALDDNTYLTLADVAKHTTNDDCWLVIHGKVYDVSGFGANGHPGGEAVYEGCGKDATNLFETRPMGSGTPHSDRARVSMVNYEIGILVEDSNNTDELNNDKSTNTESGMLGN